MGNRLFHEFAWLPMVLFCLLALSTPAGADTAGYLARATGSVTIDGNPATRGDQFIVGNAVETGDRSLAVLKFTDSESLLLRQNSRLLVEAFHFDRENPGQNTSVKELVRGGMRAITGAIGKQNREQVQYKTPYATIGIRGTEFLASLVSEQLFLRVDEGTISFAGQAGDSQEISAGETVILSADGALLFTGEEAEERARQAGAFSGLNEVELPRQSASPFDWGSWYSGSTPAERPSESALSTTFAMAGIVADGLPALQQQLDIPVQPDVVLNPDFQDIGGAGVIRGQLVWNTEADLDLHLQVPGGGHVSFANRIVNFDSATAELDHDNLGGQIDVAPDLRVENIVVTGTSIPDGSYQFHVNYFGGSGTQNPLVTVTGDAGATRAEYSPVLTAPGQNSDFYIVDVNQGTATYGSQPAR